MRQKRNGFTLIELLIAVVIIGAIVVGVIALIGAGFPNTAGAQHAIEAYGFKDVKNVERHWLGSHYVYGCDSKEAFAFTAQAINSNNQQVSVVACTSYLFKAFTVRVR